jgi:hypothetical protein
MQVRLLGGGSGDGGSPRLWATDRDTFAVQGYLTETLGTVEITPEVPSFAEPGTWVPGLVDTPRGTFRVTGAVVDDPEALSIMQMPAHEGAVEIPIGRGVPGATVPA